MSPDRPNARLADQRSVIERYPTGASTTRGFRERIQRIRQATIDHSLLHSAATTLKNSLVRVKKYRQMCPSVTSFEVVPEHDTSAVATSRVVEVRR
jgi:hypothetical protein